MLCLLFFTFAFRPYPVMLWGYFWPYTQEPLLTGLREHVGCQEPNPGQLRARRVPHPLCFRSGPQMLIFQSSVSYMIRIFPSPPVRDPPSRALRVPPPGVQTAPGEALPLHRAVAAGETGSGQALPCFLTDQPTQIQACQNQRKGLQANPDADGQKGGASRLCPSSQVLDNAPFLCSDGI